MSSKIDPRILAKLEAFAARRRKLIIIRGAATALGMLLVTMLIVAAVDYLFVLPDEVRWGLSGAAYLAVIIAEWRTCLRLLTHSPGPKVLARLIEHAEPKLREDLLSAVELGATGESSVFDSPQFRGLVQQDVASRMDGIEVERLLPARLVRRYVLVAGLIVVGVGALFVVTGFQLGTLMLRALVPGANLARVSKTHVEILNPSPAETRVPFGDAIPLIVRISGAPVREAWLETFTEDDGREKVKLTALGKDQFSGAIQVGRENLHYRVRAGDAITRKYLLDAEARPYVVRFTKTYHSPAYTKTADRTVTEEGGDLVALEGSSVDLVLETNQAIKGAELRIDQGKLSAEVPLTIAPDGKLSGRVQLTASGTYRVHLASATTGFENKFSPEYELRAEPDLVPKIDLTLPKSDLIMPANDFVDLEGEASDDQALARVEQHVRINDGPWTKTPLAIANSTKTAVKRRWDLYAQGVKAGDLVTTKLVAFDMKGNHGESRAIQITVTAAGVEMKRLESLDSLVSLHESLRLWRQAVESLTKAASESRQRFEQTADGDPQRTAVLTTFGAANGDFERQHSETAAALATALRKAQPGHQSADLVTVGRQIAKTESFMVRSAKIAAAVVAANPSAPYARDLMRDIDDSMNRASQRARAVEEGFRVLLNSEEADLLAENAQIIRAEQLRLVELARASSGDASSEALGSRMRVVLAETKGLEDILGRLSDRGLGGERGRNLAKELKKQREAAEKSIGERAVAKELLAPTLNLAQAVTKAEKSALDLRAELERRPVQVVKQFRHEMQPTWTAIGRMLSDLDRLEANKVLPDERREQMRVGRWESCRDTLKTHGDLEEIRPTSDPLFVSDVRSTTSALEGLRVLVSGNGLPATRERIVSLDRAFRLLEGAHDLQEILDGLIALSVSERWQIVTPRARTAAPRDWGWLEMRLRDVPGELQKLDLRESTFRASITAAHRLLASLPGQPAYRELDREMNDRRKPDHEAVSTLAQAESVAAEVKRALDLLRPHLEAARQEIGRVAPKLNEFAQALTKKAEELKQETKKQQEAANEKPPEEAKADAEKALAKQKELNEKIDALKDLLRADANKQDMLEAAQRERARDADDALAMLKDPPPKASEALKDAAEAQTKSTQQEALAHAAEQQEQLEKALDQIAKHYEAMEQGKDAKETRTAMRAKEEELGLKQELDEQYAKAERMAQLAKSSPQEMLEQLERALPTNPLMQQELSSISQNTLTEAHRKLEAASKAESRVAEALSQIAQQENAAAQAQAQAKAATPPTQQPAAQPSTNASSPTPPQAAQAQPPATPQVASQEAPQPNAPAQTPTAQPPLPPPNPQLATAAKQQGTIAETAGEAGADVSRAGRHEERLKNTQPGQQLQQLGKEISKTASEKVPAAEQALTQAQRAAQAQEPVNTANQELASQRAQLSRMARGNEGMPPIPDLPPAPGQMNAAQQQSAQQMAQSAQPAQPAQSAQGAEPKQGYTPDGKQAAAQAGEMAQKGQPSTPGETAQAAANAAKPGEPAQAQQNAAQPGKSPSSQPSLANASPAEQTWMARTLDALDSALNAPAGSQKQGGEKQQQQAAQQGAQQQGQNQPGQQQQQQNQQQQQQASQNGQQSMQQAQNAMQQAQQAAQNSMRQARSQNVAPTPQNMTPKTDEQSKSEQGALAQMQSQNHGALPDARGLKVGDWGKLPKQMAEQLSRGQGESVAAEYRGQVETYYRVIAERAKKP